MGEFSTSQNTLVDAHNDQDKEMVQLKAKIADLEDHSWWNNVKLRGIPQYVLNTQLTKYACYLIWAILPSVPSVYFHDNIPRDVIMRVNFYHVKDPLLTNFQKVTP